MRSELALGHEAGEQSRFPDKRSRGGRSCVIVVLVALVAFAALSLEVRRAGQGALGWERRLSEELVTHANVQPISDSNRMSHYVADWRSLVVLTVAFASLMFLAGQFRSGLLVVASAAVAALTPLLKPLYARPPPSRISGGSYSFPSGHAIATMALAAAVVVVLWRTWFRWLALLAAPVFVAAIGAAVVAEQGHWPSDVLAGWALALAWVAVLSYFVRTSPGSMPTRSNKL
jgi:membrane-associated phospholipid phosphatase